MAFEELFYPALATIALGNGLFLPSLPSQVNSLYAADDPRRDSAYNIYYVGINLGAVLAPLICGALGELYGWHWGFGAAGVGMCVGLIIYIWGGRYLPAVDAPVRAAAAAAGEGSTTRRLALLFAVIAIIIVFRVAYEQTGNTVALWADGSVDRGVGAWTIPSTWFQALNPLLVFALTPVLLAVWARRLRRGAAPAAPLRRMAFGALIVATSYAWLTLATELSGGAPAHWLWLATFFLIYTLGELHILPTGLALFGRMAPPALAATTIALWFSASFAGNLLAGGVGSLWSSLAPAEFFTLIAAIAALAAGMLLLLDRSARALVREPSSGSGAIERA
jgi:POT family proton-dependent oligopeptide transporter